MLDNLLVGMSAMIACLLFQSVMLVAAIRFYVRRHGWIEKPRTGARMLLLTTVMLMLVFGNLVQIGLWAGLFYFLDEFSEFATAFYFSAVNFATLGYGDIVMSDKWRLLGPIESLNGIIMVGVSTSALLWIIQDTVKVLLQHGRVSSG